jgi:hypothetical protein
MVPLPMQTEEIDPLFVPSVQENHSFKLNQSIVSGRLLKKFNCERPYFPEIPNAFAD